MGTKEHYYNTPEGFDLLCKRFLKEIENFDPRDHTQIAVVSEFAKVPVFVTYQIKTQITDFTRRHWDDKSTHPCPLMYPRITYYEDEVDFVSLGGFLEDILYPSQKQEFKGMVEFNINAKLRRKEIDGHLKSNFIIQMIENDLYLHNKPFGNKNSHSFHLHIPYNVLLDLALDIKVDYYDGEYGEYNVHYDKELLSSIHPDINIIELDNQIISLMQVARQTYKYYNIPMYNLTFNSNVVFQTDHILADAQKAWDNNAVLFSAPILENVVNTITLRLADNVLIIVDLNKYRENPVDMKSLYTFVNLENVNFSQELFINEMTKHIAKTTSKSIL